MQEVRIRTLHFVLNGYYRKRIIPETYTSMKELSKNQERLKKLRAETGAPANIISKAIKDVLKTEANDAKETTIIEKAREIIKSSGQAVINKKINNDLKCFRIFHNNPDEENNVAIQIKMGSQSEQVLYPKEQGGNDVIQFINVILGIVNAQNITSIRNLINQPYGSTNFTVSTKLQDLILKYKENIQILDLIVTKIPSTVKKAEIINYTHDSYSNAIGCNLVYNQNTDKGELNDVVQLMSHISFSRPLVLNREDLCLSIVEHEKRAIPLLLKQRYELKLKKLKEEIDTINNSIKYYSSLKYEVAYNHPTENTGLKVPKETATEEEKKEIEEYNKAVTKTVIFKDPDTGKELENFNQDKKDKEEKKFKNLLKQTQKSIDSTNKKLSDIDALIEDELEKWIVSITLLEQKFLNEKKKTVEQYCKEKGIEVISFDII